MKNYGDLLFPLVAAFRLAPHGIAVQPVAPTAAATGLPDAMPPLALEQLAAPEVPADGIVIGGGYLIHTSPLDLLEEYCSSDLSQWAGPALWIGATLAAVMRGVPVAWNAPGVPHPFSRVQRPMVDACLRAADYLAVRDTGARDVLAPPDDVDLHIVPDPIADLARMWPLGTLAPAFADLCARKGLPADAPIVAVHVRNRSIADLGAAGFARQLQAFCDAQRLLPVLVAVGRSHNDDVVAREIAACLTGAHLVYDDPLSLREMTALLAHSRLYVGASLHGYVAAAAYGVPGVLVGRPAYRKFAGFLAHTGREADLARDWPQAFGLGVERCGLPRGPGMPASVARALDAHWQAIAATVRAPALRLQARLELVRCHLALGAATQGAGWLHRPLVHRVLGGTGASPSALGALMRR